MNRRRGAFLSRSHGPTFPFEPCTIFRNNKRSLGGNMRWIGLFAALAAPAYLASVPATAAPRRAEMGQMEALSARIAEVYLRVWSANSEAAVADVPYVYGPSVLFYGRRTDQRSLAAEKRRFIQRWPIRSYAHRPGTMRVICNGRTLKCAVRSIIDWRVASPDRGAQARGSSTFDLGVGFAGRRPVILYEAGGRLRRGMGS